jgi:hypothetical protein
MAFYLSPSVNIKERDLTITVPGVGTTTLGMVGRFEWGECFTRVPVANDMVLLNLFGKANDDNYESWFSAYNFLQYPGNLYVVRVLDKITSKNAGKKFMDYTAAAPTPTELADLIYNEDEAENHVPSFGVNDNIHFYGKYPGDRGNDLSVAVTNAIDFVSQNYGIGVITGGPFVLGEIVTGDTSGATGVITEVIASTGLKVKVSTGVFELNEDIVGGTSSASAEITHITDVAQADTGISFKSLFEYVPESDEIAIVIWDDEDIIETFIVSLTKGSKDFEGNNNYIENYINKRSNWILVYHNDENANSVYTTSKTSLAGGVDAEAANSEIFHGFDLFVNPEEFDVNMLIDGAYTNSLVQQYIIDNILEVRRDCVGYFTVPKNTVVGQSSVSAAVVDMIEYRTSDLIRSSSYFAIYGNWKYQYDKINDKNRWLGLSADVAGITARTAMDREAWFAPAGYNRGLIKNVIKLAINPVREYRDLLYPKNINPCMVDSTDGPVVLGQKTGQTKPSAFDRLDIRWLFIVLEKAIAKSSKYFMFEKNSTFTRRLFIGMVEPFLRDVQGKEGIEEFRVVCDETNNTGEVRSRNEFVADIFIKPLYAAEFIILSFVATKAGASFDEIIGQS